MTKLIEDLRKAELFTDKSGSLSTSRAVGMGLNPGDQARLAEIERRAELDAAVPETGPVSLDPGSNDGPVLGSMPPPPVPALVLPGPRANSAPLPGPPGPGSSPLTAVSMGALPSTPPSSGMLAIFIRCLRAAYYSRSLFFVFLLVNIYKDIISGVSNPPETILVAENLALRR